MHVRIAIADTRSAVVVGRISMSLIRTDRMYIVYHGIRLRKKRWRRRRRVRRRGGEEVVDKKRRRGALDG